MKELIRITITLVVVYIVAGFILSGVFAKTSPVRYKAEQKEKKEALKALAPQAEKIEEKGKWSLHEKTNEYYEATRGGDVIGYMATSVGKGYGSYIKILIFVDKDIKVMAINILSHGETPGFIDEVLLPSFTDRFKGKSLEQLELVKVEGTDKIQAVTGATRSSRGVLEGVREAVKILHERYGRKV